MAKVTGKSTKSSATYDVGGVKVHGGESAGYAPPPEHALGLKPYSAFGTTIYPDVPSQEDLARMEQGRAAAMSPFQAELGAARDMVGFLGEEEQALLGAEEASIQQARRAAARAMFGAGGGLGGLAGSGAARASLAQSGLERASAEQGIRQAAAAELSDVRHRMSAASVAEKNAALAATPEEQARLAVNDIEWGPEGSAYFGKSLRDLYNQNVGESDSARRRAANMMIEAASASPWPEVHQRAQEYAALILLET